jgi:hypothetical protein
MSYFASIDRMEMIKKESTEEYPTGYTSSALPFYPDLDDKKLERFCADMLNLHPVVTVMKDGKSTKRTIEEATLLGGGCDQKGADVRAKDDQGAVWIFQCKHTKNFGRADVLSAIELAEKGSPLADQYVLVITCGLSKSAQEPLDARPKWRWWDASRLTMEVLKLESRKDASALVRLHFGPDWVKRLFPCSDEPFLEWQEFFQRDLIDTNKHFRHTIPFVPWSDALSKLEEFAQTGAGRALILSAAGGQGKSRLLLELAQRLEEQPQAPRVYFLNLNRRGLSDEQSEVISREEEDVLLVVDDAHRMVTAIQDVARAAEKVKSIRLLIATRPETVDAIRSQLYQNGYDEKIEEPLRLAPWQRDHIRQLAEQVLDAEHRSQAPVLASLADLCPLLVVLGAGLVNSGMCLGTLTEADAFRERVFKSFKDVFLSAQPEATRDRLSRVISFLSFVSPTRKNDALLNNAAEILGCSQLDIDDDLGALEAAGLLVENWEGIRLYPDLFADAVLLDACLGPRGHPSQLHKTVLDKLKIGDFPALLRNIAQADWEARSRKETAHSLFDPIWQKFITHFEKGSWAKNENSSFELYMEGRIPDPGTNRIELLELWALVAVFLPERTLELTNLAIKSATSSMSSNDLECACLYVPPLLKPIVESHPAYAKRALDLLWKLASLVPDGANEHSFAAITTIAETASFALHKPIEVSEQVLSWLEQKIEEPEAFQHFRSPSWILSAMLKPFFVKEAQDAWYPGQGNSIHIQTYRLRAEKARPLRQRALTITEKILKSSDTVLSCALVPVLKEAIKPAKEGAKADQESWRQDCLDVLKIIEAAVEVRQDSPALMLKLRAVLRNRQLDQDSTVRGERDRILSKVPDTLELRVARVLTSYANIEYPVRPGPSASSERMAAEQKWVEFTRSVALETSEKFKTPHQLCKFLRRAVGELNAANENPRPAELFQYLPQIASDWWAALLKEMVETDQPALDRGVRSILFSAVKYAPEAYRESIEWLPVRGRPSQLCELILFLGWKQANLDGLTPFEREVVLSAVKRPEESVVGELTWLCGFCSRKEPKWAMEVLSQLQPRGEQTGSAIMEALGRLVEDHASDVESQTVALCLAHVDEYCFPESSPNEFGLTIVAQRFPKEVYEHVRRLCEQVESDSLRRSRLRIKDLPSLGPLGDAEYVDQEIRALWERATTSEEGSFSQEFRLDLIRSLLWSDAGTAPDRLRQFVIACQKSGEIKLLARLAATKGSRFVFAFPDIVRSILARGQDLGAMNEVTTTLLLSAVGGSRTYTDSVPDPEYKYIREQGEALANRHQDDPLLSSFYRAIAESERRNLERLPAK